MIAECPSSSKLAITKIIQIDFELLDSAILELSILGHNEEEDWAVLLSTKEFTRYVTICSENDLPSTNSEVEIRHYPVGMISSCSLSKLDVSVAHTRLFQYECDLPPATKTSGSIRNSIFKITTAPSASSRTINEKVAVFYGGLVDGSCWGPVFIGRDKVMAFHFESVNDSLNGNSDGFSHQSVCKAYVYCRLPNFWNLYTTEILDEYKVK